MKPSEIYATLEQQQFAAWTDDLPHFQPAEFYQRMTDANTVPHTMIENPMAYIDTDDPTTIARYQSINAACKMVYDVILQDCPSGAERTLAIRKLQEARMWANAAIAFDGKTYQL